MLYWIAGYVILAALFYGYLVLTARRDPYEEPAETPAEASEPAPRRIVRSDSERVTGGLVGMRG
jgi:hypothetical protein